MAEEPVNNTEQTAEQPAEQPKAVTKHSLCLTIADGRCVSIIPKGSELPVMRSIKLVTCETDQPNICLDLRLGESKDPEQNFAFSRLKLDNIPKGAKGATVIRVTVKAFVNNVYELIIRYTEKENGRSVIIFPSNGMSQSEIQAIYARIKELYKDVVPRDMGEARAFIPIAKA
ncbi:MAG: Hsp70 family protein [Dehalococcoidales bacterium]|nr:Hsp70 family protein [Dehalococcoidales bacterium]